MPKSNEYSNLIDKIRKLDEENKWLKEERENLEDDLEEKLEEVMIAAESLKREKEYFELKSKKLEINIWEYEDEMRKKAGITEINIPSIDCEENIVTGIKIVDENISEDLSVVNRIALSKSQIKQKDNPVNSDVQNRVMISSCTTSRYYIPHPDRIIDVTDADVLCGKGGRGTTNWHIGNSYYRSLCKEYQLEYLQAIKGKSKNDTVNKITDIIKSKGGRFLTKNKSNGTWMNVGDIKAREKTKQALREGLSELRRKVTHANTSMLQHQQTRQEEV